MADLSIDVENAYKSIVDSGGDLTDTRLAQLESVVALNNVYIDFLKIIQRVGNEQNELDTPDVTNFNISDEDTQKAVDNYKRQFAA